MEVFISWSGSRSRQVATALRKWLPQVLGAVDPWMSDTDISAGAKWSEEVSRKVASAGFGILCLTPENLHAPWLLYEAGALSRTTRVVPYLIHLKPGDIRGPLEHLQVVRADKSGTLNLVKTLNEALEGQATQNVECIFEQNWGALEKTLTEFRKTSVERLEQLQRIQEEKLSKLREQKQQKIARLSWDISKAQTKLNREQNWQSAINNDLEKLTKERQELVQALNKDQEEQEELVTTLKNEPDFSVSLSGELTTQGNRMRAVKVFEI